MVPNGGEFVNGSDVYGRRESLGMKQLLHEETGVHIAITCVHYLQQKKEEYSARSDTMFILANRDFPGIDTKSIHSQYLVARLPTS